MARASYIYILRDPWNEVDAAFTVKHELEAYVKNGYAPERYSILRVRDGGKGGNTVLKEFTPEPL
jgi:hypothetical protein